MKVGHAVLVGELADRGEFLHAGAGGVGVQDADADTAFVRGHGGEAVEDAGLLLLGGDVLDPAAIAHGAAEGLERGFLVGAGHGADAGEGPVGRGAVVEDAALLGLAGIPGGDGHDAGLEVERGGDAVEGLHAVGRDRLAVGMQVDEARRDHQAGGVDDPFGLARDRSRARRYGRPAARHRRLASMPVAGSMTRPPLISVPLMAEAYTGSTRDRRGRVRAALDCRVANRRLVSHDGLGRDRPYRHRSFTGGGQERPV